MTNHKHTYYSCLIVILGLFLGLHIIGNAQGKTENIIKKNYLNYPLIEVINEIETLFSIPFYYKDGCLDSIYVNFNTRGLSLNSFIEKALTKSPYSFIFEDKQQIYIVPRQTIIYNLSRFGNGIANDNDEEYAKDNGLNTSYIHGRAPNVTSVIKIGSKGNYKGERLVNVKGNLVNIRNNEPLIGATIFIKDLQKGAASGIDGFFSIMIPVGKYEAVLRCVGMKESSIMLEVASSGIFTVALEEDSKSIDEVVISGQKSERGSSVGLERLSIKSIKELPSLMGEKDVIKISQMLPGIVSVSEGSSGINVRGGNADQNLFYLNNIPLYNTSHLFGFFSTINSDIINDFTIYKGYVPTEFGGRISSIFDIETRYGSNKKFFMQGGVSPISANIHIESPIIKDKLSVIVSGRSSYSDWMMNKLSDPELRNSSTSFYDFASGVSYEMNANNKLKIFSYYSYDKFNYNDEVDYNYKSIGSSLGFMHRYNENLKSNLTLSGSQYSYNTINATNLTDASKHSFSLEHYETKGSFDWILSSKHNLNLGANAILFKINRGNIAPYGESSIKKNVNLGKEQGIEYSLFVEEKYNLNSNLSLMGGFRLAGLFNLGPSAVYEYNTGYPIKEDYLIDTITYESGQITNSKFAPELRFAVDYKINNLNSVKLSYTQMQQHIFMLSNSYSISPTDQWKLVDKHIKTPKSDQIALGYYKELFGWGVNLSSEIYYKRAKNIVEYKDGADFENESKIETLILQGEQNAYGAEFMIAKNTGKLSGWMSYTYSRSFITVDGDSKEKSINNGKTYPSNYDKPHVCNMVATYKVNRRFSLSSNLAYSTGRPITLPQSIYYIDDSPYVEYSERNKYRVPDYFRLDFSVTIEGNLKANKPFHSYWMVSVYNATGRSNPYSVYFKTEDQALKGYQYSIIGVPIFTVSWNIKLGNYLND